MKMLQTFAAVLLFFVSFISCSKDNDDKPQTTNTIEGVWEGKFGTGSGNPSSFFSFNIKAGGILEELTSSGQVKGKGTWKLENNIFSGHTINVIDPVGNKYSYIGAFYSSNGEILGNWGYGNEATDGGLWEMTSKK